MTSTILHSHCSVSTMTERLSGQQLLDFIQGNPLMNRTEQCHGAGYLKTLGDGSKGPAFTDFYEAILEARKANGEYKQPTPPQVIYESCPNYSPAIYVRCLASYNEGNLWGRWIDLQEVEDEEELKETINKVLKLSPHPNAEEYAIHDYSYCPNYWGEWPDFTEVMTYVEAWVDITDDDAYTAWCNYHSKTFTLEQYNECMVWEGEGADYAEERANEDYTEPGNLFSYVDWERVWEGEYNCAGYIELYVNGYYYIFNDNNWQ